jgi:tripartite-type tricarboxylate transporter receptor subunit TctC
MVPRATPDAEVARLHAGIRRMAAAPDFAPALLNIGYDAITTESPAATDAMIAAETPRWRRLVEISGARAG